MLRAIGRVRAGSGAASTGCARSCCLILLLVIFQDHRLAFTPQFFRPGLRAALVIAAGPDRRRSPVIRSDALEQTLPPAVGLRLRDVIDAIVTARTTSTSARCTSHLGGLTAADSRSCECGDGRRLPQSGKPSSPTATDQPQYFLAARRRGLPRSAGRRLRGRLRLDLHPRMPRQSSRSAGTCSASANTSRPSNVHPQRHVAPGAREASPGSRRCGNTSLSRPGTGPKRGVLRSTLGRCHAEAAQIERRPPGEVALDAGLVVTRRRYGGRATRRDHRPGRGHTFHKGIDFRRTSRTSLDKPLETNRATRSR
jgi:hypothetical protein